MLLRKEKSCLVLIDVQEKLAPYIERSAQVIEHCQWLMRLATELDVPLLVTEQYSRGLGQTIEPLRKWMPGKTEIDKLTFSCARDPAFQKHWQIVNRRQAVLIGIETHVCVLQTAMDLRLAGIEVFVVTDAVGSRHAHDHEIALGRLQQAGVQLITHEMVFFEWLEQAGTSTFKTLSQVFIPRNQNPKLSMEE